MLAGEDDEPEPEPEKKAPPPPPQRSGAPPPPARKTRRRRRPPSAREHRQGARGARARAMDEGGRTREDSPPPGPRFGGGSRPPRVARFARTAVEADRRADLPARACEHAEKANARRLARRRPQARSRLPGDDENRAKRRNGERQCVHVAREFRGGVHRGFQGRWRRASSSTFSRRERTEQRKQRKETRGEWRRRCHVANRLEMIHIT